ncbi:unnamed protein product [Nezara viridula]|uniref:Uncharacterized protein n=1 Tax=Nezara viridula TaxID=85310 RepID=A0A9P0MNF3_NEZVI|nr:unnamed protein product [Nezara viridula]
MDLRSGGTQMYCLTYRGLTVNSNDQEIQCQIMTVAQAEDDTNSPQGVVIAGYPITSGRPPRSRGNELEVHCRESTPADRTSASSH